MSKYEVTFTVEANDQHDAYNKAYASDEVEKVEVKRVEEQDSIRTFDEPSRFAEEQIETDE